MDGFKNTTKTQYSMGGYATGGSAKFGKVMREFKAGTLHSGSKKGPAVTSPKQAFAIAASEARKAPMKKQAGGEVRSKDYKDGYKEGREFYDNNIARSLSPSEKGGVVGKIGRGFVRSVAKTLGDSLENAATAAGVATTMSGRKVTPQYLKGQRAGRKDEVGYAHGGKVKKADGGEVRSKLTQAERNARDWKKDLRDSEHRAVDKLGYNFNGVKVYPGDKVPSKAEREDGGRAIKRLNRLGFAYRGFDAETGEGMDRPLKYDDDGRPLARAEGGPISRKTGTRTDPEYGDFVAAGAAKKAIPVVKKAVPVASRTPMVSAKKPMPRAMFGDEAAAAMNRSGKAGMTAAEKREGYNMGGSAMRVAEGDYGYKKGGRTKGPKVMAEKTVATKRTATPTMNAQEMRTMQRYRAAMASRPNRQPIVAEGKRTAAALTPILRRAMAAAPPAMNEGALPMAPPTMKKGGKARFQVMRKAEGGAVTLSFTPPSAPPAGQRWIQRDDGQLLLVSTDPNATYVGRSGTVKKVSDLSVYQGGEAGRPVANFVANTAPDVLANLRSVGGLDASYDVPDAGEIGNRQNAKLSFTPPGVAPAGQRYVQRDDGALVLVSTDPNATYAGRSGTIKNVSDLSIYQGGNAYIPAANFAANSAPEVIANLQRVGGLPDTYKTPAAGTLAPPPPRPMPPATRSVPPPGSKTTFPTSSVAGGQMGSVSNPAFQSTGSVDPRNLAETYRASVPGYSYGEDPAGERQFFRYAVAPGAPPPYKAGGAVSVPKTALAARTAQKHTAAMASRPNRKPMVGGDMRKGGTSR